MNQRVDVIIVGAGPAGSSAALGLEGSGLKVALIDRHTFPRDKICGDALSPDVVNQLATFPFQTQEALLQMPHKVVSKAVRFVSPNYTVSDVKLTSQGLSGYVIPRMQFDAFLVNQALQSKDVTAYFGKAVKSVNRTDGGVSVHLSDDTMLEGKMILAADGSHSIVKRSLHQEKPDKGHYCAGLRIYYEGVTGFSEDNAVELHFYKELLPGYFWVFPLANGQANVGIGMLSDYIQKKQINLKEKLHEIITTHPNVKDRFKHARPLEDVRGFPLPLGSKKRVISGDNFLLLGDAASLINPLSGEGIANAIRSGRVAADHLRSSFKNNCFSAYDNRAYDQVIYRRMWNELRMNYWVQRFMRSPKRCEWLLKYAIANPMVQDLVMSGFDAKSLLKRKSA